MTDDVRPAPAPTSSPDDPPRDRSGARPPAGEGDPPAANQVCLVGRVSGEPVSRTLPSGTEITTVRVVVARVPRPEGRAVSDWFDCTGWSGRTRRSMRAWSAGDVVEVEGALRRRHYRTPGGGGGSRVEVEVSSARRRRP